MRRRARCPAALGVFASAQTQHFGLAYKGHGGGKWSVVAPRPAWAATAQPLTRLQEYST